MATTSFTAAGGRFSSDVRLDSPSAETIEAMLEAEKTAKDLKVEAVDVEDALKALKR